MKILFLCKREYMNHDVIHDQYARLYEIPNQLSKRGNQVSCICLSYRIKDEVDFSESKHLQWRSINLSSWLGLTYLKKVNKVITEFKPDIILASSDILQIGLARHFANKHKLQFYADLYDNYESFGLSKIPFIKSHYQNALRQAKQIFTVSQPLKEKIIRDTQHDRVTILESTIDKTKFYQKSTHEARKALNLETMNTRTLVGLSGALDKSRGIDFFYEGFQLARQENPALTLVLAGNMDRGSPHPTDGVIHLGRLKHEQMNNFYNAMDVNCISMIPNEFGKYAFPQKAYEMAASQKPCVVPRFGAMSEIFRHNQRGLYEACQPYSICQAIIDQTSNPDPCCINIPDWEQECAKIRFTT